MCYMSHRKCLELFVVLSPLKVGNMWVLQSRPHRRKDSSSAVSWRFVLSLGLCACWPRVARRWENYARYCKISKT